MIDESTGGPEAAEATLALEQLWDLQQVDAQLARARAQQAALDDGSALREQLEAAQRDAAESAARLRECQAALRDQELRLETTEAKQKKIEGDLYGGRVSNPKELASLQEDLAALARARDQLEDRILALLDQLEHLKEEAGRSDAAYRTLEQRLSAHLAEYEVARSRLDAEIAALTSQRAERASVLEPRLLKKYEGIAAQESGIGIVAIQQGRCGGCHNAVPLDFVTRVRSGRVVTCERCHRILYVRAA
jgi:predicted  nucleic acid-binding Zn-ribbon protein